MLSSFSSSSLFLNDTATTEIYTLSLHDALPISMWGWLRMTLVPRGEYRSNRAPVRSMMSEMRTGSHRRGAVPCAGEAMRSEEHTSELQSRQYLVCSLLLEKKRLRLLKILFRIQ